MARLNFSHGDQALHTENIARIRAAADKVGNLAVILADLQGPKLRVGEMIGSASRIHRQGFSERVDGGAGGDRRPGPGRVGALLRRPALPARYHPHPLEVGPSTASNTMFTHG